MAAPGPQGLWCWADSWINTRPALLFLQPCDRLSSSSRGASPLTPDPPPPDSPSDPRSTSAGLHL